MYIQYANNQLICETFAKYKIGDVITVLSDTNCCDGIIEAKTELTITQIDIADNIHLPLIPQNQLHLYSSDYDEYTFVYTLKPIDTKDDLISIKLDSSQFEHSDLITDNLSKVYQNKKKNKNKAKTILQLKETMPTLILITVISIIIDILFMITKQTSDTNFMVIAFNMIMSVFVSAIIVITIQMLLYLIFRHKEPQFQRWLYQHLIRKTK